VDFDAEFGRDFHETLRGCQLGTDRSELDRKGNHLGGDLVTTLGATLARQQARQSGLLECLLGLVEGWA